MAVPHIGSVYLAKPLAWLNKPIASLNGGKMGSDTRTITGDVVFLRGTISATAKPIEATFIFEWETQATVAALDALWRAGQPIYIDPDGSGTSYQFMFAVENGITDPKNEAFDEATIHSFVAGKRTDIYGGKINGWILSGL